MERTTSTCRCVSSRHLLGLFLASDVVSIPTGVSVVTPTPSDSLLTPVKSEPSPENFVAVSVPSDELKVKSGSIVRCKITSCYLLSKTLHDVSDDFTTVIFASQHLLHYLLHHQLSFQQMLLML